LHTGDAVGPSTYILHLKSPFQHSVTLKDHQDNQNENHENWKYTPLNFEFCCCRLITALSAISQSLK
jgi:hypothetical protein